MVNILPKEDQRTLTIAYYTRLATAFLLVGAIIVVIGGALLAPSYILLSDSSASSQRFTDALNQTLSLKSKSNNTADLAALTEEAALINQNIQPPELGTLFSGISAAQGKNITIEKFAFTLKNDGSGTVSISGHAARRESLVSFVDALRKNTVFQGVSVPVENLAGDTDIAFMLPFSFKLR
jgi:hypothetical protein